MARNLDLTALRQERPAFSPEQAVRLARTLYGVNASARELPSERDQNFYLRAGDSQEFTLKIANTGESRSVLDLQNKAMEHISGRIPGACPRVISTKGGEPIATVERTDGSSHFVRLVTFLPGSPLGQFSPHSPALLRSVGRLLGAIDSALVDFSHEAAERDLYWDIRNAVPVIDSYSPLIEDSARRAIVETLVRLWKTETAPVLPSLRASVIHNDGNDYNLIVAPGHASGSLPANTLTSRQDACAPSGLAATVGIIDFGDMLRTCTAAEVAIAAAYVMLEKPDPIAAAAHVVGGYHEAFPLSGTELELLYSFICMRLAMSVTIAAHQKQLEPDNEYLKISEKPAWTLLEKLSDIHPRFAQYTFRAACGLPPCPQERFPKPKLTRDQTLEHRRQYIGPSLSLSYKQPLKIVRGSGQFLYADDGRPYLDCVNNVAHVGHCHPRVVQAAQAQMAVLNTNTRYLHDNIVEYARRLCAKLPKPLAVCFFVNSGSEANDLALRLARAYRKATDFIVVDGAYHGNLTSLIDISPYKFDGPGGSGAPAHVHKVPTPDPFRRRRADYIGELQQTIDQVQASGKRIAAFIVESLMSCAGQIILPPQYLAEAFRLVRSAGGICIADEVQVGFGRVGTHFWGFETQGVVPDIATMGKCIGNGHPLGAVVTTPEIAESFNNGMEYFNTYGGNPVSCAVGLAVLDVIEEENLQARGLRVGAHLKAGLERLRERHSLIGEVRGLGLFLGIELVEDRDTLAPASDQASYVVERMKQRSVLLSTDGPFHNVIKIKPPMVFTRSDADMLVTGLDCVFSEDPLSEFSSR